MAFKAIYKTWSELQNWLNWHLLSVYYKCTLSISNNDLAWKWAHLIIIYFQNFALVQNMQKTISLKTFF